MIHAPDRGAATSNSQIHRNNPPATTDATTKSEQRPTRQRKTTQRTNRQNQRSYAQISDPTDWLIAQISDSAANKSAISKIPCEIQRTKRDISDPLQPVVPGQCRTTDPVFAITTNAKICDPTDATNTKSRINANTPSSSAIQRPND